MIQEVDRIANNSKRFKIGKTGLVPPEERLDYQDLNFQNIQPVASSSNKEAISDLEEEMINEFEGRDHNENDLDESTGEMTDENGEYHLYVVYDEEKE